ncbi:L,D-transpeptidase family protein [Nocardioides panacisoli]|uniref:L,D-transpeptidase family protein n=1 Tax=Nocardioides panacisoli TaxID=627624 RepID=UPI001C62F9B4|nr:L,D-transpeptidase family protein [Nocardioides panacisoli]QYJ03798.1 L,D-transpeptidase family protein [Nocardioides panacisoli]
MRLLRRIVLVLALLTTGAVTVGAAYAAGLVDRDDLWPGARTEAAQQGTPSARPAPSPSAASPSAPASAGATTTAPEPTRTPTTSAPSPSRTATPSPTPTLTPGPRLLGQGDRGDEVRDLQARLRQIRWFDHSVTGYYGDVTATAVRGFQGKRGFPVTGEVDRRTLDRLREMSREPTAAELTDAPIGNQPGTLDARCSSGRVLCIDKSSRTLRWVVDGTVQRTVDVRFGRESMPTREGSFAVRFKSRDHVSSIYDTSMPFAMFFSGGQAVHYSPDFAANGYNGASHGCVNVRDRDAIATLFDQVRVGDRVVVYWS